MENIPDIFGASVSIDSTWIPGTENKDYFPIGSDYSDEHQKQMYKLLNQDNDGRVLVNTNPTGAGKTLSWAAPVIRSGENGEGWVVMAMYPTNTLIEDQKETLLNLMARYFSSEKFEEKRDFDLVETDDKKYLTDGERKYLLEDRVVEVTADSSEESTGQKLENAYDNAVDVYDRGLPTIILTNPDIFTLIGSNRYRDRDIQSLPGKLDKIIVDEFHLSNPRGKRFLPFHLDLYKNLPDNSRLSDIVFLSATPAPSYMSRIESAFDAETVTRETKPEKPVEGRKILPEAELHVSSREMFSNGEWLSDNMEAIKNFYSESGQTLIILDSVNEVEELYEKLEEETDLDIRRIFGWKKEGRSEAVKNADILIGNTAVEVGVDFEEVNRLIFTAYDPASIIQRIGRMRAREDLEEYKIGMITKPETHSALLDADQSEHISREKFEEIIYDTLKDSSERPYYEVLCAAYARYLWEGENSHDRNILKKSYTKREEDIAELVYKHFGAGVNNTFSENFQSGEKLWEQLEEVKEIYKGDNYDYPIFEEMHTYRPSSLSLLIIDSQDEKEPLKTYSLNHVLRHRSIKVLESEESFKKRYRKIYGELSSEQERFISKNSNYTAGFCIVNGRREEPRSYEINDPEWEQTRKMAQKSNITKAPDHLWNPKINVREPVKGIEHIEENLQDTNILAKYSTRNPKEAKDEFNLEPYSSVMRGMRGGSLMFWQDAILAYCDSKYEDIQDE